MDLVKKLEDLSKRYAVVTQLITDPELVKDQQKYRDTMREHQHLADLMALYDEYKKVLKGIDEDTRLVTEEEDHEMKEMAREELKEYEERKPQLEEQIKMKLIPPDPLDEKNIILEIRAGVGGDEASLFVRDV